jgi:hypothetical protein
VGHPAVGGLLQEVVLLKRVALLLLPDESVAIVPDPSSNLQCATRPEGCAVTDGIENRNCLGTISGVKDATNKNEKDKIKRLNAIPFE